MRALDLFTLLLLLLSWRRLRSVDGESRRRHLDEQEDRTAGEAPYKISWVTQEENDHRAIRHYRLVENGADDDLLLSSLARGSPGGRYFDEEHEEEDADEERPFDDGPHQRFHHSARLHQEEGSTAASAASQHHHQHHRSSNTHHNHHQHRLHRQHHTSTRSKRQKKENKVSTYGGKSLAGKNIRHSSRFLDKLMMSSGNLSMSEFMVNLRDFDRSRRRRSSSANLNLDSKRFNGTWPLKKVAEIEGDVYLGGLMMVHEREDSIICGPIMPQGGIQALETMLYTVDKINGDKNFLPFKLGVHILDDCDKDTYGLEQAVDFIKGSISNIDDIDPNMCPDASLGKKNKVISGVVGAPSSVTSIQVANLLRLFKIPQVSFFSTSPELSNKARFEFFARTIPSDTHQVQAMVEIVKKFNWTYISIIYEESNYGIKAFEELERILPVHNICIATKEKLKKDSGVAEATVYDRIVDKLLAVRRAKGVIIFGSDQEVKGLMKAVGRRNATGLFTWIGSDGWSGRTLVSAGNEHEVEGTLAVQPRANPVLGFDEYFYRLNVMNNTRNPWFVEFWEHHFSCKYPNSSRTPYNENYKSNCTGEEKLTPENTPFEAQLQYVSDAVMAFAYAFKDMHRIECNGTKGLCSKMKPVDGLELLKYLQKVQFTGLSNDSFRFDKSADGPARYNIIHFRRNEANSSLFEWVRVGEYNDGELGLNMSAVRFSDGTSEAPVSVCSDPCAEGEAKKLLGSDKCCWSCIKCLNFEIRHPEEESVCLMCPYGSKPDINHTQCMDIPEEYLRPSDGWAIGAMTFAGVGILLTAFVSGVFLIHNDTPVVRASGRELSYVLLTGLFSCYALTFLFVFRPNDIICGVQQFGTGFVFSVVYGALLTKTNRIARIFQAGRKSARRPSFISPRSQLVICSTLVFVQVAINTVWMLLQPPKAEYNYPTREDNQRVCNSYLNASYTIAFAYPIILIVICTVYAVLTRKIPEAFNESKYIGFTMYTTCIIWLAFVPIYFSTANQVALRITSMTVAISLSATVMIFCLFFPKLYIIIVHPERNVRQSMMTNAATRHSAVQGIQNTPATTSHTNVAPGGGANVISMTTIKHNHVDNEKPPVIQRVDTATQSDLVVEDNRELNGGAGRNLSSGQVVSIGTQTVLSESLTKSSDLDTLVLRIPVSKSCSSGPSIVPTGNRPLSQQILKPSDSGGGWGLKTKDSGTTSVSDSSPGDERHLSCNSLSETTPSGGSNGSLNNSDAESSVSGRRKNSNNSYPLNSVVSRKNNNCASNAGPTSPPEPDQQQQQQQQQRQHQITQQSSDVFL